MKILNVRSLALPEIKVIKYARFKDQRGYFTEMLRNSDINNNKNLYFLKNTNFFQFNESYSKKGTIRGFHFQWNPYMGKLVRVVKGSIIDMIIDIRKGSPFYGNLITYRINTSIENNFGEWIWVPPGFAHGILYLENTIIVYFCTNEHNPNSEASISPLAPDINWSLVDPQLQNIYKQTANHAKFISERDKNGLTVNAWKNDSRSDNFIYGKI